jgi:hypothetical protein
MNCGVIVSRYSHAAIIGNSHAGSQQRPNLTPLVSLPWLVAVASRHYTPLVVEGSSH